MASNKLCMDINGNNIDKRELQEFQLSFTNKYGSVDIIEGNAKEIMRFLLDNDLTIINKR